MHNSIKGVGGLLLLPQYVVVEQQSNLDTPMPPKQIAGRDYPRTYREFVNSFHDARLPSVTPQDVWQGTDSIYFWQPPQIGNSPCPA